MDISLRHACTAQAADTQKFRQAATANPGVNRFVINEHDDALVVPAPLGFLGIRLDFIFGKKPSEIQENRRILTAFKESLIAEYGEKIVSYAYPTFQNSIQKGTELGAATIKQVLSNANLLMMIFEDEKIAPLLKEAVQADAAAAPLTAAAEQAVAESAAQTMLANEAAKKRDTAIAVVNTAFDKAIAARQAELDALALKAINDGTAIDFTGQDNYEILRDARHDEQSRALRKLKPLWFEAISQILISEQDVEAEGEITNFLNSLAEKLNTISPDQGERLILTSDGSSVQAAPRGIFKKAAQSLIGRDEREMEENRSIVEKFYGALEAMCGSIIADFAFPTAASRIEKGSRLNKDTIQKALDLANYASEFLRNLKPQIEDAINTYVDAYEKEKTAAELAARVEETAQVATDAKDISRKTAIEADRAVYRLLKQKYDEGTSTINPARANIKQIWFEGAKKRFLTPVIPTAEGHLIIGSEPSAPVYDAEGKVVSTNYVPIQPSAPMDPFAEASAPPLTQK